MVSTGFLQNIRRDYESDTTSSEDENSPRQDIVSITPPARTVLLARLRERITHSLYIVTPRQLFTCATPPADRFTVGVRPSQTPSRIGVRMKQKIVLRVSSMNDGKSRTRSMKIAVGLPGVISVELNGEARDQILVIGDGLDAVHISRLLRKKIGFTELVSLSPVGGERGSSSSRSLTPNTREVVSETWLGQAPTRFESKDTCKNEGERG